MVQRCCVKGCGSLTGDLNERGDKIKYHRIPRVINNQCEKTQILSERRHRQWVKKLRLTTVREHTRVCSNHFYSGSPAYLFDESNPDWVPVRLLNRGKKNVIEDAKLKSRFNRYKRRINRSKSKIKAAVTVSLETFTQASYSTITSLDEELVVTNKEASFAAPEGSLFAAPEGSSFATTEGSSFATTEGLSFANTEGSSFLTEDSSLMTDFLSIPSSETSIILNSTSIEDSGVVLNNFVKQPKPQKQKLQMKSVYVQTDNCSVNFSTQTENLYVDESAQTFARLCDCVLFENATLELRKAESLIKELRAKIQEKENLLLSYQNEMQEKISNLASIRDQLEIKSFSEMSFLGNNEKVKFYTGLETYDYLMEIFNEVKPYLFQNSKLSGFQQVVLTLMKLRLASLNRDLAYRFYVSERTVGMIFYNTLDALSTRLAKYIYWPERNILQATMPISFREHFDTKVAVIIDCFEIFTVKPSSVIGQAETWSNYKHHNTVKFLIGITPQGTVSFLSKGWGGRVSDNYLTENCKFLEKLLPGDVVLADRGFNIEDSVGLYYATVKLPTFTKSKKQLDPSAIEDTRKIANVRIHVERVIGHVRQKYSILHNKIPIELLHGSPEEDQASIDKIALVSCTLVELCPSVVSFE